MSEKHGYEQVPIKYMRYELEKKYPLHATEENLNLKKRELAELLNKLKGKNNMAADEEVDFSQLNVEIEEDSSEQINIDLKDMEVEVDETTLANTVQANNALIPSFNSEKWSDYVKEQLTEDELQDGFPKCEGLRRLVEELIGPVVCKEIKHIKYPTSMDNTATVGVRIECFVAREEHPAYGKIVVEESVSDANEFNNNVDPYKSHMSAVAETRAEGRVYRRLLHMKNTLAAEEVSNDITLIGNHNSGGEITDVQIAGIDNTCRRLDINVMEFINLGKDIYNKGKEFATINDVPTDVAKNVMNKLNAISSEGDKKPEVNGYDSNWRK